MNELSDYRKKIDRIDKGIVKLFLSRFKLVDQIANYKKSRKIAVDDKEREQQVIKNLSECSTKQHKKFIIKLYKIVIDYSKREQKTQK